MSRLFLVGLILSPFVFGQSATYTVPVPMALAPFANFALENVTVQSKNSDLKIKYALPLGLVAQAHHDKAYELTGRMRPFPELFPVYDANDYRKKDGYAGQCLAREEGITCLLSFEYNFSAHSAEVLAYLKDNFPAEEQEPRAGVVHAFGNEAGGVLHIPGKFTP